MDDIKKYLLYFIICICVIIAIYIFIRGNEGNCSNNKKDKNMEKTYTNEKYITSISNINNTSKFNHPLCNYYIAGSYNSCCSGTFKKSCVSISPLKTVIKNGARILDFEIFSINKVPVIAVSPNNNVNLKGSYNYLSLDQVFKNISENAFTSLSCPNPSDPLFLNFRIKSNRKDIYDKLSKSILEYFEEKLLDKKWGYGNSGDNDRLHHIELNKLKNKVIIMAHHENDNYKKSDNSFYELVNLCTNSTNYRFKKDYDVVNAYSDEDLIDENKTVQTITIPDWTVFDTNSNAKKHHELGCQMVLMNYQNIDNNMEYYIKFFNKVGSAFALKPENMRWNPPKNHLKKLKKDLPKFNLKTMSIAGKTENGTRYIYEF